MTVKASRKYFLKDGRAVLVEWTAEPPYLNETYTGGPADDGSEAVKAAAERGFRGRAPGEPGPVE